MQGSFLYLYFICGSTFNLLHLILTTFFNRNEKLNKICREKVKVCYGSTTRIVNSPEIDLKTMIRASDQLDLLLEFPRSFLRFICFSERAQWQILQSNWFFVWPRIIPISAQTTLLWVTFLLFCLHQITVHTGMDLNRNTSFYFLWWSMNKESYICRICTSIPLKT